MTPRLWSSGGKRPVVVLIDDMPECDPGATMPIVLANEHSVAVAFSASRRWISLHRPEWERCVVGVRFDGVATHSLGAPNDEAFSGHPLAKHGLQPYGFARIEGSPLIESLRVMNAVHPLHRDEAFTSLMHVVMPFHDTTFECVADSYVVEIARPPDVEALEMVTRLLA